MRLRSALFVALACLSTVVLSHVQARAVRAAEPTSEPLTVALMVDTSKPNIGRDLPVRDLRAGLTAFAKTIYAANPESKISLMDFSGAAMKTVNFTSNSEQMLKALSRIVSNQRSGGVLLEGLVDTGKDLAKATTAKKVIVVVSFEAPETSTIQPKDAIAAVQKSGAAVWVVSVGANVAPTRNAMFDYLPAATGGKRLDTLDPAALEKTLSSVAEALTAQLPAAVGRK